MILKQDVKKKYSESELNSVLEFWNSMGMVKHGAETKIFARVKKSIQSRQIDISELKVAIKNYSIILKDATYYFKYKWNLADFIWNGNSNFGKFLPEGKHFMNYPPFLNEEVVEVKIIEEPKKPKMIIVLPVAKMLDLIKINELYNALIIEFQSMDYQTYLQTEHWLHFRLEALKGAGHKCRMCNADSALSVHHNNYSNRGRETFNDVIVLCGECHAKFHGKREQHGQTNKTKNQS